MNHNTNHDNLKMGKSKMTNWDKKAMTLPKWKKEIPEVLQGEKAYYHLETMKYGYAHYGWVGKTVQELLAEYTPQEIFHVCNLCNHRIVNGVVVHITK